MKFVAFSAVANKLTNFWLADLESCFQVWPKHSTTLQCHQMKLRWRNFGSGNLPFTEKKAIKFDIWTIFACSKEIYQFLVSWSGNLLSGLVQTFHNPSVSQNETPVRSFASGNLPFIQKKPIKFEIWTLLACSKEIDLFF